MANDHWNLVLNENQATLGRVFFALKRHETDVSALTDAECEALWEFLKQTKNALTALFHPDHYNYMFLMNLTPHVHCHIFPRYAAAREFLGQIFTDTHYGDHYDPAEDRPIDDTLRNGLISSLRMELDQTAGAAL